MVDPSHLMMAILHPKDRFTAEPRPALQPWDVASLTTKYTESCKALSRCQG